MMDRRHDEEENIIALYEASLNGCVSTFNALIQRDALILNKVSLTSFSETSLHIAALLGHLEFTKALVSKKPKLGDEVDSLGRTPLHLASAEGHIEIVKALLQANTNACLAFDQDERTPLHLAAMRGRIEVIKELIIARPESILVKLNGDTVLNLCVRYNHLDALKLLVQSANGDELFLNSKDHDGNSILHLAVMLKQMKAIKYLLSVPEIKGEANAMSRIGYTALDVLEVCPRDFKSFEIQNVLKQAGVKRSMDLNSSLPPTPSGIGVDEAQLTQSNDPARLRCWRWWGFLLSSLVKHLKRQGNWIDEIRGALMLVATVIASMAFQAGINPPGGVWQEDTEKGGISCTKDNKCDAGTSVLAYSSPYGYILFMSFNTASFCASLCIVLLVISGFALRSKFFIWVLTLAMTTSIASMTLAYLFAVIFVTPNNVSAIVGPYLKAVFLVTPDLLFYRVGSLAILLVYIWMGVVVIVSVIHIIRPLSWMVKKLLNFIHKPTRDLAEDLVNV